MSEPFEGTGLIDELTLKQREVLDLLIQHKTSKEISRLLGISPHTVDQRITLARAKFKVSTRNEVAQAYSQLIAGSDARPIESKTCDQSIYQNSHVAGSSRFDHTTRRDDADVMASSSVRTALQGAADAPAEKPYYHVLPEVFDGPYGTLLRLGAMTALSILVILVGLGGLSMFAQLSTMFDL
ncbi:MAG: helix-turn-helix transcriptional regulator [Sphingomonadales bacterium]|nr:helix-turn-helix transcriptional regulator [Sphingomonadales bacterium]MDE2570705.1 helix-turn-helix transcriptional regulator [Sphingomonadales bacterium]